MFIRLIKPWRYLPVGRILDVTGGVADLLVRRQFAELQTEDKPPTKSRKR